MKLELKHLAPYLPYGIRVRVDYYTQHEGRIFNFSPTILLDFSRDEYIVKPILRPLSDLDQDGEINTPDYLQGCCYSYVQHLISRHYDVFGLIEQGLAIDFNNC